MRRKTILTTFVLSCALSIGAGPIYAQQKTNAPAPVAAGNSGEVRINLSGKLRMLSQRIPAAACHLSRGIDTDAAYALLRGAVAEFDSILNGLEYGDTTLNIHGAEQTRKALAQIRNLKAEWGVLRTAAVAIADKIATEDDVNYVLTENLRTLKQAQLLVEELTKAYENPNATTRASLMLVDISGRQRMLTQKMSKESCMIDTAHGGPATVDNLEQTMSIFVASLDALRFGMQQVGINPPPNQQITDGLNAVVADWAKVEPLIVTTIEGQSLDSDSHAKKFQQLNVTMSTMNKTVGMYAEAAKPTW